MTGIYVHIPFCVKKCPYCDFYSLAQKGLQKEYAAALIGEMKQYRGLRADTVFIGGGTPTAIGGLLLEVVRGVNENFILENGCEFTVEANPATADDSLFAALRALGVNRLSIGAQSFDDGELKLLGRAHTARDTEETVCAAKKAGFSNISLDLMLGIPRQTLESARKSALRAVALGAQHISAYSLIIEENTPFYGRELPLPDEELEREIYYQTRDLLQENGFSRYEISNFAKAGRECRHNIKYWTLEDYMGFGAAAHSLCLGERFFNEANVKAYIGGAGRRVSEEFLSGEIREKERFMLGLRMAAGIAYSGEFPEKVEPLIKKGLLEKRNGFLRLTERGTDVANRVFGEFI